MNDLFRVPGRLPDVPAKVPMFRATEFESLSSRDSAFQTALAKRIGQAARVFEMESEPDDQGERIVFRNRSQSLEVYCASDSVWWTNHDLAYLDRPPGRMKLPSEIEAKKIAQRELQRMRLDIKDAHISTVGFVEASMAERGQKPCSVRTALDVNYEFSLGKLPVFGPGAKIKVSFSDGGRLAQVIYFWRRPKRAPAMPTISPGEILERFQRDPAFFRLRDTDAAVEIRSIQFGYFAMSPGAFQRFYVPVYAIDAMVRTREFPRYEFRRYAVAVNVSAEVAKGMDVIANPAACRMF